MKITKTQKGITLIALIITIIVLLILAIVAIRSMQDGGVIRKAEEAVTVHEEGVSKEEELLSLMDRYIRDKTEATDITCFTYSTAGSSGTITGLKLEEFEKLGTKEVVIPYTITDENGTYKVESIGESAFETCRDIESISIPDTVVSIGEKAFDNCNNLKKINIPDTVTSIGKYAFNECDNLTSINIPNSLIDSKIPDGIFAGCNKLIQVNIPNNIVSIGNSAFASCVSLESINIPNTVKEIGDYAFAYCTNLANVTIPEAVISIGESAFADTFLSTVTIPASVDSIGALAFWSGNNLTSINVAEDNKKYSSENGVLFNYDKTVLIAYPAGKEEESYTIPNGVTTLENYAFGDCRNLSSIIIPETVDIIPNESFTATLLTDIYYKGVNFPNIDAVPNRCNVHTSSNGPSENE